MRFHIIERLVTIYVNYEICHCNYADNGIAAGAYESDAISVAQSNSDTLPVIWLVVPQQLQELNEESH